MISSWSLSIIWILYTALLLSLVLHEKQDPEKGMKKAGSLTTLIITFIATYSKYGFFKQFRGFGVHIGATVSQGNKFILIWTVQVEVFYSAEWNYLSI